MVRFLLILLCIVALGAGRSGRAGPPLFTDDPGISAPRELQAILLGTSIGAGRSSAHTAGLDLAYGVNDWLELDLIVAAATIRLDGDTIFDGVPITLGVKMQLIDEEAFSLAISPWLTVDATNGENLGGTLPLSAEFRWPGWSFGAEGRYGFFRTAPDLWFIGGWAGRDVAERHVVFVELWSGGLRGTDRADTAVGIGGDFELLPRLHLLASLGTGVHARSGNRIGWTAYLGLQAFIGGRSVKAREKPSEPGLGPQSRARVLAALGR